MRSTLPFLALLAGCATPAETIRDGDRFDYRSERPARTVVACVQRNADEMNTSLLTTERDGVGTGERELVVRNMNDGGTIALVRVTPAANGSSASVWSAAIVLGTRRSLADALMAGC